MKEIEFKILIFIPLLAMRMMIMIIIEIAAHDDAHHNKGTK
jgi:hypothetical protein